jgi:predicted PurR-regulated permease PerM
MGKTTTMPSRSVNDTARRAFVASLVVVGVVVAALALWKLKLLISLLFLGFIVAAAMRPGVEALARRRIPRPLGVAIHYLALAGLIALFLWFVVPRALDQLQIAIGDVPTTRDELHQQAKHSTGIKHEILKGIDTRLRRAPTVTKLVHPALDMTRTALEILVGIFFVFATAAYWIFERDRAERVVLCLLPPKRRRVVRETWNLVDLKLGAYVRGSLLLILFVSVVLSVAFWLIGLPYWMLLGVFAGIVEIVPVVGPLAAGVVAVGVGLTVSVQTAALAALAVYGLRVFQDYIVNPRVLGHAVGLTPLVVLVGVFAVGLLFGGAYVPLATPFVAVIATLLDVIVRGRDPAKEPVPAVIFPAQEAETAGSRGRR